MPTPPECVLVLNNTIARLNDYAAAVSKAM